MTSRVRPDGVDLLRVARRTLLDELLPRLPDDERYAALMTANAMAIAARESEMGERNLEQELRLLTELYGERIAGEAGQSTRERVLALDRMLAKDIRAGSMDGACAEGVRALLRTRAVARVRVSNPKFLAAVGLE